MKLLLRATAALTGFHAVLCVLVGAALVLGGVSGHHTLGLLGVVVGLSLIALGYYGAFAAGSLWALENRGRRATVVFTAVLTGLGVACALYQWRISAVGAAWQASVLALLLMPASRRACAGRSFQRDTAVDATL